jgi:predicted lactoylglutathione lyase
MAKAPKQPSSASLLQRWENEGGATKSVHRARGKPRPLAPEPATSLYYFHIRTDSGVLQDPEGLTLPDLSAARQEALTTARDLIAEGDRQREDRRSWRFEIADRANDPVLQVVFSDALDSARSRAGKPMEQRISVITLGVRDLRESQAFYERLGWKRSTLDAEGVVFFQVGGMVLSLFSRQDLAKEAHLSPEGSGFCGMALTYNTRSKDEVDEILEHAEAAGARILKPAQTAFWGGYSGYFSDPDGFPWEVAWNPGFQLAPDGRVTLPERSPLASKSTEAARVEDHLRRGT